MTRPFEGVDTEDPFGLPTLFDRYPAATRVVYWRGLPDAVLVPAVSSLQRRAKEILGDWPIRRVGLTCVVENIIGKRYNEWPDDCCAAIWDKLYGRVDGVDGDWPLRRYDAAGGAPDSWLKAREAARADLESRLAPYGRKKAGLPPLTLLEDPPWRHPHTRASA